MKQTPIKLPVTYQPGNTPCGIIVDAAGDFIADVLGSENCAEVGEFMVDAINAREPHHTGILPGETSDQMLARYARTLDKSRLIFCLIKHIDTIRKNRRSIPLWSEIGEATGHGSGVSGTIVDVFYTKRLMEAGK